MLYTSIKTKIGIIYLLSDGHSLTALDFHKNESHLLAKLDRNFLLFKKVEKQLNEYLDGKRKIFDIPLNPNGTEFQKLAWKTLLKIPYGSTLSYGEQAKKMNKPKAFRATGSANGKNPIPVIIPCHRIITSDGKLGGYSGELKLKKLLLKLEGNQF